LLDRLVELLARWLDAVGGNGTRLRWRWNQRKRDLGEAGMRAEMVVRGTRVAYKMCPSCRALVPRSARTCTECQTRLAGVRAPGLSRAVANLIPGATATTAVLLLANTALFAAMLLLPVRLEGYDPGPAFSRLFGFDPLTLVRYGSGFSALTVGTGEWWRLLTPVFLHGGFLHFAMNSWVLVQLGPLVEEEYGTERFWVTYLLCGLAGSAASQFLRPVNTVGASGALMGMMGLLLVHGWRSGGARGEALRQSMLRFAMYIVIFSLLIRGIDHINHAGGFVCGALLGLVVPAGSFRGRGETAVWETAAVAGVLLVVVSFYKVAAGAIA